MNNDKQKLVFLFPHSPNPRMIKRINALKDIFNIEVIYWNRGISSEKDNKIPNEINTTIINRQIRGTSLFSKLLNRLNVVRDSLKYIKKIKPNYIYTSKTDMLLVGQLYKKLFNRNVEVIYEVSDLHTLMVDNSKNAALKLFRKLLYMIESFLCKNIKLLVITSEYFYTQYYENFVQKEKVLFIPNTPDPDIFQGIKKEKSDILRIGFIGSIRYAKQIEMLIDVAQKIDIKVLIAGNGDDYSRIKEYSKNKKNTEVYGEYNYENEIKLLYEKIDLVYSVYDINMKNVKYALPNRLYEGIYTQTPIIAANETYLGEIVETNNIGSVIKFNSITDLIDTINQYKSNIKLQEQKLNMLHLQEKWRLDYFNNKLKKSIMNEKK